MNININILSENLVDSLSYTIIIVYLSIYIDSIHLKLSRALHFLGSRLFCKSV